MVIDKDWITPEFSEIINKKQTRILNGEREVLLLPGFKFLVTEIHEEGFVVIRQLHKYDKYLENAPERKISG